VDEVTVVAPGINGKMSEWNAALGLLQLRYFDQTIARRKAIDATYRRGLADVRGIRCLPEVDEGSGNYAYFPILVESDYGLNRDALYRKLKDHDIHVRRYFYPLISEFPMYRGLPSAQRDNLPVAKRVSDQVLCLPIYPALSDSDLNRILSVISTP
jgi:dTDP-4-amino-4,6-dideoxygalactose transaminase